jgi:hypothetical protein
MLAGSWALPGLFGGAAAGISPPFRLITLGMGPFALSESGVLYTQTRKPA